MIMIVPEGGMGNRLRSICSAVQLSADTNQKLYIIWCNDKVCCYDFYGNSDYTGFEFCHNIVKKVDDLMGEYEDVVGIDILMTDRYLD